MNLLKTQLLYKKDTDIKGVLRKSYRNFDFLLIIFNSARTGVKYNRIYSSIISTNFINDYNNKYNSFPVISVAGNEAGDGSSEIASITFEIETSFIEVNDVLFIYEY